MKVPPLDDVTFAFLDVETTGLSPRYGERVCEIAVVRSRLDLTCGTFASLVNPHRPISPGAAAVNGLCDQDVLDAPNFADVVDAVLLLLRDAVLVCHNAPFDLGFLSVEFQRAGKALPDFMVLDTLELARRCYRFASNSLPRVAAALGIPTPDAHRALGDALTTREVFNSFVDDLRKKRGARTLADLQDAQGGRVIAGTRQRRTRERRVPPLFLGSDVPLPLAITEALGDRRRLFLVYVDGQGERTERWVTPQEITGAGDVLYLVALCHLRGELRQFRLDRIIEMRVGED